MLAAEQLALMTARWVKLLTRYGVEETAAEPPLRQLVAAYSSPERHYHTLEHLAEMFAIIDRLASAIHQPEAVDLAIWFHDAVYDARAKDNEERSAELARELLTPLKLPVSVLDRVTHLVRATAHLGSNERPLDSDTTAFLDADLAILGRAPERYLRYVRDIRLEYHWVPGPEYRMGRAAVLRKFLARPRIFHHPILFEEREAQARENLSGELTLLDAPGTVLPLATL
jgi:predicted metal-dependent HD superfamily phosphohydrolase